MHETPPVPEPLRDALTRLAALRATGALHVAGPTGGTLWLVDGEIGYAETPALPGIGDRLVAAGRLPAAVWDTALRAAKQTSKVGEYLVEHGHLVHGELVSRVLAAVYETGYLLLADDSVITRFHPDLRHWLGPVTSVDVASLEAETTRRRQGDGTPAVLEAPATGEPSPVPGGRTSPNGLPQRISSRPANAAPFAATAGAGGRPGPDYATLRRIRIALKTML